MSISKSTLYNKIYHWKNYEKESESLKDLILINRPNAKRILDIACGTANHHKYLKEFFLVDGLDKEEDFINTAQILNPSGSYFCLDMKNFDLRKEYDVITCLFSSISYAANIRILNRVLKNCAAHLKEDGLIIFEPWITPEKWLNGLPFMFSYADDDLKITRMNVSKSEDNMSILDFHYLVAQKNKDVEYFIEREELRMYSNKEMLDALNANGFSAQFSENAFGFKALFVGVKNR